MLYEVPLLPDEEYVAFLAENIQRLHSVHFSLHTGLAADGRPPSAPCSPERLTALLSQLPGPRKYALLNSRFNDPAAYQDNERLNALAGALDALRSEGNLHGIVYADHYLLQALSDACPGVCAELEAVPSINAMLDSAPKVLRRLHYISTTAFRPPGKIILDRSLNRNLPALAETSSALRQALPDMNIALLANEGCLPDCPFKAAHDSHISLSCLPHGTRGTFTAIARLGCGRHFATDPSLLFQSPFIRPEDAANYAPYADVLKLCGRTMGSTAMRRIVSAYVAGRYEGNLLDILDSLDFLAPIMRIDNQSLPLDFLNTVSHCDHNCPTCPYCPALAASHVQRRHPGNGIGRM